MGEESRNNHEQHISTQIFKHTTHTPILIDGVKRALNIQSASKERGASFFFPLLAKSKQMWSNLMHTLYVGRRVALYALVPDFIMLQFVIGGRDTSRTRAAAHAAEVSALD